MNVREKVRLLPHNPGVYRFLNSDGEIIYIGKAKDLKNRVSQYFHSSESLNRKTILMVSKIADLQHTVVSTEEDAFLLENNLIKQYKPKYNILLKDDKTYPWICIKNEEYPRVFITRHFKRDKSLYFGPYSSALHAHNLINLINSLYKLRTCNLSLTTESINNGKYKVCLNYHLGRCLAPCVSLISSDKYMSQIDNIIKILKGDTYSLILDFETLMKESARRLDFEKAQEYKEKKELLERHYSKSLIVNTAQLNVDVFSLVFDNDDAFGNFMRVSKGCVIQSYNMEMKIKIQEDESTVLSTFIAAIYSKFHDTADAKNVRDVIVPFLPEIKINGYNYSIPTRGDRLALLKLSSKNAAALKFEKLKQEEFVNPKEHSDRVVDNLMKDLAMDVPPTHIECFDNSNIQGTNPVASCVVFKDGAPSKKDYRHFNIKTVLGADDFASMKEVINRRYSRLISEGEPLPQLIVIDGGKGQVHAAYQSLQELGLADKIKMLGIAKRLEELIVPGDPYPLFLDKNSTSLKLIMHLRDEAHRFGITHHRNKRSASQLVSELDTIPGVGEKSREKLISKYGSFAKIKRADHRDIKVLIGARSAKALFDYLQIISSRQKIH